MSFEAPDDKLVDMSTMSWANMLFKSIWPKAMAALIASIKQDFEPRLQRALPMPFNKVRFARLTLGSGVPEMGPIEVRRRSDGHVQLELDLCYDTECDLLLEAPMAGSDSGICF
eukprot:CAMPEP_0168693792 /NCGR_PEP_ID=MMETSP0503-20121227/33953_1 /TAXON_ID=89963 /ORGANISM="Heterocapsa rotundata, Strain SCCAP K-0483" /LENGTH=113 /DNA_ID=CAMNT_0008739401 /DNA_START=16 /DNA_END=354 /DNA_ORIENTATION=-